MAYKLNEKTLVVGKSFTYNEILYPRNWLQLSTEEERSAIGITWEDDVTLADDKYYWGGDVNNPKALDDVYEVWSQDTANHNLLPDGVSVGDPKYVKVWDDTANNGEGGMVDSDEQMITRGLKYEMTNQVKDTAGKLLSQTDWYVTRKVERNVDIPTDVTSKRVAIVAESERLETAIADVTTVEQLIEVMQSQNWSE